MSDETEKLRAKLREDGWVVAVHNDYRMNGVPMTFWLFTRDDRRWIKGEGRDDRAALEAAIAESQRPDVRAGLLAAKLDADRDLVALRTRLDLAERIISRLAELEAERDAARAALEAIAKIPTIWSHDAASGHYDTGRMDGYGVRRRALAALDGTPGEPGPITPPAVCTHPSFDESGRCHTCGDVVASVIPCGFARTVAAIERSASPAAPMCATWCGTTFDSHSHGPVHFPGLYHAPGTGTDGIHRTDGICYCAPACRDAGRPLHPTTPTPTEETPR
jgi:hypothetical protein